ncbi:MAG: GNAT family N-acetyltransferase [Dehalococcoidia bacterium]
MATEPSSGIIETHALTPDRWRDFAALMNSRFDTRHCWCMWPRLAVNYTMRTAEANRRSMKKAVDTAPAPPGILAYADGVPVGWCAVAPREDYLRLARSRITAPLDDQHVWSVVCFYVPRPMRRRGVSRALLAAALDLAQQHGARIVEAYPVEGGNNPFRGLPAVFKDAGFREVGRRTANRPFLRYHICNSQQSNRQ